MDLLGGTMNKSDLIEALSEGEELSGPAGRAGCVAPMEIHGALFLQILQTNNAPESYNPEVLLKVNLKNPAIKEAYQ